MFKMFQMDEYLRTWRDKIDIAGGRDAGKICAKTGEFNSKMSYFRNANGIIYCDWEMRFNGDVQMISRHERGYNFLWFNRARLSRFLVERNLTNLVADTHC